MKFLLLFSLISFSSLSFSTENPLKADVIQAIKISLETNDLDCVQTLQGHGTSTFKASLLDHTILQDPGYIMTISEDQQPVVITFFAVNGNSEMTTTITINSDLTTVEGIKTVEKILTKVKINTGTIFHPHYEEKVVKKINGTLECK